MTMTRKTTGREGAGRSRGFRRSAGVLALALVVLVTASCATHEAVSKARDEEKAGHWDLAVIEYAKAVELDPMNVAIRNAMQRAKFSASQDHFRKGKAYRAAGNTELALIELGMAVALDPNNSFAQVEFTKAKKEREEIEQLGRQKTPIERLKEAAKGARVQPPMLNPKSDEPISLSFPKETSIKDIYQALAKAAGINILFDNQLKDDKVTVELKDVSLKRGLEILMRQSNHFYKVLDEQTIFIAADTPQNRKDFEDLVIKTFFLSSGDVKEVMNVLRTLIEARRIAMNPQLNAIVIRDTVDKVAVAERIVEANDKAKAEVVIDVELMQVNSSLLKDIGVDMSMNLSQSLVAPGGSSTTSGTWHWNDIVNINAGNWVFGGLPSFTYTFLKNNGEASLLAKPQLRITEGEKATLVIGDRVPIPTTTFNTSGTIGGNIVPITSFQYQDVGIKIDMEPRVHHNREVTLKLTVEVSQLGAPVVLSSGQSQPSIGTRTVTSIIRLRDGETNYLAGLIRTDTTHSESGIPFLMDIPVIGRLFTHVSDNEQRKDVMFTLTPHIIRMPDITEEDLLPIWVGTENNVTFQGSSTRIESPASETPFDESRPLRSMTPKSESAPRPPSAPRPFGKGGPGAKGIGGGGTGGGTGGTGGTGGKIGGSGTGSLNGVAAPTGTDGGEATDPGGNGAPMPVAAPAASSVNGWESGGGTDDVRSDSPGDRQQTEPEPVRATVPVLRIDLPDTATLGQELTAEVVLDGAPRGCRFPAALVFDPLMLDLVSVDTSRAADGTGGAVGIEKGPGAVRFDWTVAPVQETSSGPLYVVLHLRPLQPGTTSFSWTGGLGKTAEGHAMSIALSPAVLSIVSPGRR